MNLYKNNSLTHYYQEETWRLYPKDHIKGIRLAEHLNVRYPMVYIALIPFTHKLFKF